MDWRNISFDWNRARAFLVTAEEGSLSAPARALGLAQPTLGRQVDALEQELGVVLFERVGRGLRLTPAGQALLDHVRDMGTAAARFSLSAHGQNESMAGSVAISASDAYAGLILPPILAEIRAEAPEIELDIVVDNRPSDLLRREADIAIRNFRPKEPDLVARKIREAQARVYGTPGYLATLGGLHTPADLARATIIGHSDRTAFAAGLNRLGLVVDADKIVLRSDNYMVIWAMVKQGLGISVIDERIGDGEPGVVRALPELAPVPFPIWLVTHREVHSNPRVRFVFDRLAVGLA